MIIMINDVHILIYQLTLLMIMGGGITQIFMKKSKQLFESHSSFSKFSDILIFSH